MTEQWQELKEAIIELRDSNGTLTQQEVCKFLVNYMEVLEKQMQEPTEKCKGCYYNDGDTHAECVVCDKESRPTDAVSCNCTTEEIAKSFIEDVEAVKDQLEQPPSGDCISREQAINDLKLAYFSKDLQSAKDDPCIVDAMTDWAIRTIKRLPSVTPRMNLAETSQDCISRQKALDCFEQTNTRQGAKYAIETLPSVTPTNEDISEAYIKGYDYGVKDWFKSKTQPCDDCVSRADVKEQMLKYGFNAPDMTVTEFVEDCLQPVTPQPKIGRWIKHDTGHSIYYDCSRCGCAAPCTETADKILWKLANFCPDCGAKMEVEK